MVTTAVITPAEYLRCSDFEPDAEFVDDHVEERPMGERDHNDIQRKLLLLLSTTECEAFFDCIPEQRIRVSATRYRIPDLCLLGAESPIEQVVVTVPLLCLEVLSPEDTMRRTMVRVKDFLAMGVPAVWIFDPKTRVVHVCTEGHTVEQQDGYLEVPVTPIRLSIAEVFSILDKRRRTV